MHIKVERNKEKTDRLIFTITVSQPHLAEFGNIEQDLLELLDYCIADIDSITLQNNALKDDILSMIHFSKEKAFLRVIDSLKFSIKNQLEPKFKPICQEIYNWIYDYQGGTLKKWLQEFDPQRTNFYFDNDKTCTGENQDDDEED